MAAAKPSRSSKPAAKAAAAKAAKPAPTAKPAPRAAAKKAAPNPPAAKKAAPKAKAKAKPAKSSRSTVLPLEKGLDAAQRKLAIQQRQTTNRHIQDLEAAAADKHIHKEARKLFRLEQMREENRLARVLAEQWRLEMAEAGASDSPVGSDALHASISDKAWASVTAKDQHKAQLQQKKAQLEAQAAAARTNNLQKQQQGRG